MTVVLLLLAGVIARAVGSAGGITSLVAYPALVFAGLSPLAANVSSTVAILGSGVSSSWRAWRAGSLGGLTLKQWLAAGAFVAVSLMGGVLVVSTPAQTFAGLAPILVALGSTTLLAYPLLVRPTTGRFAAVSVVAAFLVVAAYNGYFGAGSGIVVLSLLMVTLKVALAKANDMKNALIFVADLAPSVAFVASGLVTWWAVIPLGIGAVIGGALGPELARRAPQRVMRIALGVLGLAFAAWLAVA